MHMVALGTFTTQQFIFIPQLLVYWPLTNMLISWLGELRRSTSGPALAIETTFCYWVQLFLDVCRPFFSRYFILLGKKFTYIYCCIIWWPPNESFFFNFQLPNGQLLILDFSFVQNILITYININYFWKYVNLKIILIKWINLWRQIWWRTKCGF
jgi:hypothetical protein